MRTIRSSRPLVLLTLLAAAWASAATAQTLRGPLFDETDAAVAAARTARVDLLAPRTFGRAMAAYEDADSAYRRGRDIAGIQGSLRDSRLLLAEATRLAKITEATLASAIKTRDDAHAAGAPNLAAGLWREAEQWFARAATEVERGDVRDARRYGTEAETRYRDAELSAIKSSLLEETRQLLARAEAERVRRYAPLTLARSQQLLAEAERELDQNRYDSDRPRDLAQQAKYEAEHALHMAGVVRATREDRDGIEKLILEMERPLIDVAATLDLPPRLQKGPAQTTGEVVGRIESLQKAERDLIQELADARAAEAETREALSALGAERADMELRLTAQSELRRQVQQVDEMFAADEAVVLRQGNDIILRVTGLSFASGQAVIEPANFSLLTRIQDAIRVFPGADVIVEGHTDAYGGDEANFLLSEQRAEAVRQYLLANMQLDPARIQATGYGETRPVANNETPEGRARNRRIDVVIRRPAS